MALIEFLKTNENIRKIFGKRELEIIEKQVNGISLSQSEKNRLSRDIRKKFECIKELAKFENEFILAKNQKNNRIIQRAVNIILQDELKKDIKAILLFGSFADESFTSRSDIDICIVFKKEISLKDTTKFRIRMSGQLPEKADIQVFNVLPFKIKKTIAENHKVLYKSGNFDNVVFSVRYLKDNDYFLRMRQAGLIKNG
jgi:predicted nucleotidyltransferase